MKKLIAQAALAEMLGVSIRTLEQWRVEGRGPGYYKLGRIVRYDVAAVERWIKQRRRHSPGRKRAPRGSGPRPVQTPPT